MSSARDPDPIHAIVEVDSLRDIDEIPDTAAPAPLDLGDQLADLLAEHGVRPEAALVDELKRLVVAESYRLAGGALHDVLGRLKGSAAAVALRRAIAGEEVSLRDAAREAGCSHVALLRMQRRIGQKLRGLPLAGLS